MKTNIMRSIAVAVAVLFIAGNAFAEWGCASSQGKGKCDKAKTSIAKELGLTADQEKSLEAQKASHREAMKSSFTALKEKKRQLQEAIVKPGSTKEQVEPLLGEVKKMQSDLADKRVEGVFAVKAILTPEQFAKLETLKEKRMHKGKMKHGEGRKMTRIMQK